MLYCHDDDDEDYCYHYKKQKCDTHTHTTATAIVATVSWDQGDALMPVRASSSNSNLFRLGTGLKVSTNVVMKPTSETRLRASYGVRLSGAGAPLSQQDPPKLVTFGSSMFWL